MAAMPRKPQRPRPKNDTEQHKRFVETAREVEVDERPGALDRAFERIADKIVTPQSSERKRQP